MPRDTLDPTARDDRLVAAWQRLILVLLVGAALALTAAGLVAAATGRAPLDALPPYYVTALDVAQAA
jgi:hypothetical protein